MTDAFAVAAVSASGALLSAAVALAAAWLKRRWDASDRLAAERAREDREERAEARQLALEERAEARRAARAVEETARESAASAARGLAAASAAQAETRKKLQELGVVAAATHALVNSGMGRQLRLTAKTARAKYEVTGDEVDRIAAELAERELGFHVLQQAAADAQAGGGAETGARAISAASDSLAGGRRGEPGAGGSPGEATEEAPP